MTMPLSPAERRRAALRPSPIIEQPTPEPQTTTSSLITTLPAELDMSIYAGDTLTIQFKFTDQASNPVDMSGTWTSSIRNNASDPDPPLASFTLDSSQASTGIINATLSSAASASLPINVPLVWDLEQTTSPGNVRTTHRGTITVTEDVTRP
jgi:hypothetical protein